MDDELRTPTAPDAAAADTARRLVELVRTLVAETQRSAPPAIGLDSRLVEDLGIDSLARVELNLRLEKTFGRRLEDARLASVETPREILAALRIMPAGGAPLARVEPIVPEGFSGSPEEATTLMQVLDWHVERHAGRVHVTLLGDDDAQARRLTYGELQRRALCTTERLVAQGLAPGQTCALMLPTSLAAVSAGTSVGARGSPASAGGHPRQLRSPSAGHGRGSETAGATDQAAGADPARSADARRNRW